MNIAAIVYRHGTALEDLFAAVRDLLLSRGGRRLGGVIPRLGDVLANGRRAMLLDDLDRGDSVLISQELGAGARGCMLDPGGLALARSRISDAIVAAPDLLFLGRFGKEEQAGRGIRPEIGEACAAGLRCLIAVEESALADWIAFSGADFDRLAADVESILRWVEAMCPPPSTVQRNLHRAELAAPAVWPARTESAQAEPAIPAWTSHG